MRAFRIVLAALALFVAAPGLIAPAQAVTLRVENRPLSPAEARLLTEELARLAANNAVQYATLEAVAAAIGQELPDITLSDLIAKVTVSAGEAANLRKQNAALQELLAQLPRSADRAAAEAALAEAQRLFDTGQLEAAQAAFARIATQRLADMADGRAAWLAAIDAQAATALLRFDHDAAASIRREARGVLARVSASLDHDMWLQIMGEAEALYQKGDQKGDNAALTAAIDLYRNDALALTPRSTVPLDWAATQNNLGNALLKLGERKSGTAQLEEAVAAFREALTERTRERAPLSWAMTQNNLGNVLVRLGERESGTARLEEAVVALRAALEEYTRERAPLAWATTQNNLANVLMRLGQRENGTARLEEAVAAFREALTERTRERVPLEWAATHTNLGIVLMQLGERESGPARLEEAIAAFREALTELTRERVPLDWAKTQTSLGIALATLGERESGTGRLEEAVAAYKEALKEYTRARVPLDWAMTQNNLGLVEEAFGAKLPHQAARDRYAAAEAYFAAALEVFAVAVPAYAETARRNLDRVRGKMGSN